MAKIRQKMSMEQRAKQFMPFDGLEGYKETLQRKLDEWKLLSEDEDTLCYYLNEIEDIYGRKR